MVEILADHQQHYISILGSGNGGRDVGQVVAARCSALCKADGGTLRRASLDPIEDGDDLVLVTARTPAAQLAQRVGGK
jgi:hypothetical protein